jgi:hypothetical protein
VILINLFLIPTSAMYGKANTQIIRLAAILQAIETAFNILLKIEHPNKYILSADLKTSLLIGIKKSIISKITSKTLCSAKRLREFFILNRLILAGYGCNFEYKSDEERINFILTTQIVSLQ